MASGTYSRRELLQRLAAVGAIGATAAFDLKPKRVRAQTVSSRPAANVTGPISGGKHGWPFAAYLGDLGKLGYVEEEYFLEGQATAFKPVGVLTEDGRWTVVPDRSAPYKTRILVRRPREASAFNGTVILEWTNVSAGFEIVYMDPPGIYQHGFAYVAVSAQTVGLEGFPSKPRGLRVWDPERYGSLSIPDDSISYDIFTQAARAVGPARSGNVDPMGGLNVRKLIGVGGSQSGTRIMAYLNGVQPREHAFDAIMPVECAGTSADFSSVQAHPDPGSPKAQKNGGHSLVLRSAVRTDISTPVMVMNTETECLFYYPLRQPNTDRFMYWEVAGSSHVGGNFFVNRLTQQMERDGLGAMGASSLTSSKTEIDQVPWLPTYDAALLHVHRWISDGILPPPQPLIDIKPGLLHVNTENLYVAGIDIKLNGVLGLLPYISRDDNGNALGGVRLPELDAPIARYSGIGKSNLLAGETVPFSPEKLKRLYPTHEVYVQRVTEAAQAAWRAGVILPYRVKEYIDAAKAAAIPG